MLKIVTVPNKILTMPVKPVVLFDKPLQKLIKEMEATLNAQTDPQGVGLAAPQVGINLSLFIIKPTPKSAITVFINPKILKIVNNKKNNKDKASQNSPTTEKMKKKSKIKTKLEGCLSISRIWGPVKRADKILLEYQTIDGQKKQEWFAGFEAVIIQHEVDHLNGILFTQRVIEQKGQLYEEKEGRLEKLTY